MKDAYITDTDLSIIMKRCHEAIDAGKVAYKSSLEVMDAITILLLSTTGMRGAELAQLPAGHVDTTNMRINVVSAKRGKNRVIQLVNIPAIVELFRGMAKPVTYGSLYSDSISRTTQVKNMERRVQAFIERALGRSHSYTLHSFRHSFAIRLLEQLKDKGNAMKLLQFKMGHKSIASTGVYLEYMQDRECDDAMTRMQGFAKR